MESQPSMILNGNLKTLETVASVTGFFNDSHYHDYAALTYVLQNKKLDAAKFLLSKKCRVNINSTKPVDTPLHLAVKLGETILIAQLLIYNASVSAVNSEGNSSLHLAYLSRCDKIVDLMLDHINGLGDSELTNIRNWQGLTHFHIACANDDVELVERFLKTGVDCSDIVNTTSPYCAGYTALHFAISNNCIRVSMILLKHVNLQTKNSDGLTSLQLAYQNTKISQIVFSQMLAQSKKHKSSLYKHPTYFHMACLGNFSDLVDAFIENGVDINAPLDKDATFCPLYSPLHWAVESQCKKNVELLLKAGADLEQRNNCDMTPLHLSLYSEDLTQEYTIVDLLYGLTRNKEQNLLDSNQLSYFHIAVTRNDIDLVKEFLDKGRQDVNQSVLRNSRNFSGFTPLHFAVSYGHLEMSKVLINHGASVNDNWSEYGAPLHLAFESGRKDLVDLLLQNNAKVDVKRIKDGKTMLHLLVESHIDNLQTHESIDESKDSLMRYISKLVDLGCDVNAKEVDKGDTALHLACSNFSYGGGCAMLLLEMGANVNVENKHGMTPLECALDDKYTGNGSHYMALYHHVQQLKALGLQVNPKNEKFCEIVLERRAVWEKSTILNSVKFFSDDELQRRDQNRSDELKMMQSVKLNNKFSLLDFLLLKPKYAAIYAKNHVLTELVQDKKIKQKYPLYAYLIRLHYWKALQRFNLKGIARRKTKRGFTAKTGCIGCVGCRFLK